MKQPACVANRWGYGTTKSKENDDKKPDSQAIQDMEARLKAIQDARLKQDMKWLSQTKGSG